ncbi:hypothetical protein EJ06DRAFT_168748 [Trichodelitschia bisporula]|uniref:Xylanolytic transcriptional activator regulatory domain-containing protein n=1 Tax=Trichodelitschia bisporula TaxID=703511 RepID=A0A6G1HN36_9PEZI|nr:hypothetical protein EJ06DRAFT_168748 [Trichodelitschia bisporula]
MVRNPSPILAEPHIAEWATSWSSFDTKRAPSLSPSLSSGSDGLDGSIWSIPANDSLRSGSLTPPSLQSSGSRSSIGSLQARTPPSLQADLDVHISTVVYSVLDSLRGKLDVIVDTYFRTTHTWLSIMHKPTFYRRLQSKTRSDASFSVLLLCMHLVAEPLTHIGKDTESTTNLYHSAKSLHSVVLTSKGPSLDLVQAGILIALCEHYQAVANAPRDTLENCKQIASHIGLDATVLLGDLTNNESSTSEEWKRTYWGLVAMDRIVAMKDENRKLPLLLPRPPVDAVLPSSYDAVWLSSADGNPAPGWSQPVASTLPVDASSFARQAQVLCVFGDIIKLTACDFGSNPDLYLQEVLRLDCEIQKLLTKLLTDCKGSYTQYCCPISMSMCGIFFLHCFQLDATAAGNGKPFQDAAARSRLAIDKMVQITVDILHVFPFEFIPELSPPAFHCTYLALVMFLKLEQLYPGEPSSISQRDFDMVLKAMTEFSTAWGVAGQYVDTIKQTQESQHRPAAQ